MAYYPGENSVLTPPESVHDPSGESQEDPSKLSGFLKNISFGNRTTKDGAPAKRRGPKPDAKPAQTRRQELNRQAQRTHRERKETYLRSLEQEIARLREAFAIVTKEKTLLAQENNDIKNYLKLQGLSWPPEGIPTTALDLAPAPIPPPPPGSLGGIMPSIAPLVSAQVVNPLTPPHTHIHQQQNLSSPTNSNNQVSPIVSNAFDTIGIDFVLALERPCMDHIQKLMTASIDDPTGQSISGHALMASCPPESHILDNSDVDWGSKTYDLQPSELNMLLNLSPKLTATGEITPINAWALIQNHPNFLQLTRHDFIRVKNELLPKVKCYGFGAVLEEYMVLDALDAVFASKYAIANQRLGQYSY